MDLAAPGTGGVQSEAAQEAEAVQDFRVFGEIGNKFIIALLVKIEPGLVAAQEVSFEFQTIQTDGNRSRQFAPKDAVGVRKTFKFARRKLIAFNNGAGRKKRVERFQDHLLALVHAKGRGLDYQYFLVFIDDESAEEIAFSVYDSKRSSPGKMLLTHRKCGANAFFKKGL